MPTGPYTVDQILLDFFVASLPWFVLAAILNRWLFERANTQAGKYLCMPLAVLLNLALIAAVIPYLVTELSNEMTLPGAGAGVMIGAAVGLMLSVKSQKSYRPGLLDEVS